MANALETTFKNLQSDERYKKLERTLKMALLKNAERRSSDSGNTGTWPNVSSINGDHLDTSLAAMSIQSSRVGSEVVSSSMNLRNILLHKQHCSGPRNNIATSSENQFPTNKDNDDSAMMPPPRTPGVGFGRNNRFSGENQRVPLLNMPVSSGRNTKGFSMSTPASSISSIPKCAESISVNSSTVFQENNNYGRNGYEETVISSVQKQERNFSRWRVMLNDKVQLIIKGTLECGKVARSKPVIRRLSPTSVQSVFKHTYHLQGNLVDDRGELPDYVRGKFYNGFPDDWENVYQVWRNFINDGSRMSFRWPTPVTDSDDDIKSGITEITYRPERYKKSTSPRKRNRSAKTSKLDLSEENNENRPDPCSGSHNATDGASPENSSRENHPLSGKSLQSHSKTKRQEDRRKTDATLEENQKFHDCTTTSLDSKNSVNSLAGYIPEDKLNIIIDNLTNKNCPIEYIQKIVQMFDCMKYVASYPSLEMENEKGVSISNEKEASKTAIKKDRSSEEKIEVANISNSKNRVNTPRPSLTKVNPHANQLPPRKSNALNSEKSGRQTRRQLMSHDYETSESDDDFSKDRRNIAPQKLSAPERVRKTQKYKNSPDLLPPRQYVAPEKLTNVPDTQYSEAPAAREHSHDSSISDEEFIVERKRDPKLSEGRTFLSPRKIGPGKENRIIENYDSSISITEDEERYMEKSKTKELRKDNYDSSVSITEDEHADGRNRTNARNYYPEQNVRSLEPETRRNVNSRDGKKKNNLNFYPETKSRPAEQRNEDNRGIKRLDTLDYYPDENIRHSEQSVSRNGDIRDARRKDSLEYCPEESSRHAEQNLSRNVDDRDGRKRQDSSSYYSNAHPHFSEQDIRKRGDVSDDRKRHESFKYHVESNSDTAEQNVGRSSPLRNLRAPRKTFLNPSLADDDLDSENAANTLLNVQGLTNCKNLKHLGNEQENDTSFLLPDAKNSKKLVYNREIMNVDTSKTYANNRSGQQEFQRPGSPEIPSPKSKTQQVRKKPIVVSTETMQINLTAHDWQEINCRKESDKNAGNSPRKRADGLQGNTNLNALKSDSISQKTSNLAEPIEMSESGKPNTRSREANAIHKVQESRACTRDNKIENIDNSKDSEGNKTVAEYGSEVNPKLLTAWVPAVICDDDGDKSCHLIFEGKLLNEAGHVANRKFVTDIIRRRLSPRIIETISHEFYKLVGDLNDTKHVVPKELIKLCHNGCPGKIGNFCERWKSSTGESYKSPSQERTHNKSVDCLGVPMSSRGRRILPPLNYWAGERVVTKDNKTVYSPGTSQECSIPSSLENSTLEGRNKKNSPKARPETKKTNESRATETKKKDVEKISPPRKSAESPLQARGSQKTRAGKRRLTKNVQVSSSESDDGAETKPTPRKRKTRVNDKVVNTDNVSNRKLRNSIKNSSSPQSVEDVSPQKGFDKSSDPEVKLKLRKRQKIDENQGTLQQFLTRRPPEVKCTFYKNVPMHDGDLSEDQLSTM